MKSLTSKISDIKSQGARREVMDFYLQLIIEQEVARQAKELQEQETREVKEDKTLERKVKVEEKKEEKEKPEEDQDFAAKYLSRFKIYRIAITGGTSLS